MNVLDLFSGIGGFSLGLERAGMKTIAFCEIDPFCRRVLKKHWQDVPIFEDVKKLHERDIIETVDVVCGGFPCQPFSVAGKKMGINDNRYLWPEMLRIINEFRPSWVIGENVSGAISILKEIKTGLEVIGYKSTFFDIPASALGFPDHRRRVWIIANSNGDRLEKSTKRHRETKNIHYEASGPLAAHCAAQRLLRQRDSESIRRGHGVPGGLYKSRLKALGNSVKPQIPELIGKIIMEVA
jgi:DNA (cytosine-5)-methyltransferase 1